MADLKVDADDPRAHVSREAGGRATYGRSGMNIATHDFLQGLAATDITAFYCDRDTRYVWVENPAPGFETIRAGALDADILPPDVAERLERMKRRVLESGAGEYALLEIDVPDRPSRWFDIWIEPDGAPEPKGLLGFAVEVTQRVEREERLRILLREVSHRSRNLLAIVQSIASQTVQGGANPQRFIERFNERLQSLAHTLDIVTLRDWDGATLHQLVSRQAGPFVSSTGVIEVSGIDPVLTPNAALHLGLAVQELASNASSHGVWSLPEGMVLVKTAYREPDDPASGLVFEWREAAEPDRQRAANDDRDPDTAQTLTGPFRVEQGRTGGGRSSGTFGSRTLMRIVPASVGGEARVHREQDQFVYELTLPASNFEEAERR